ncbi:hypothetical protein [Roseovarius sp. E0-M6]|uniref:hypothetical protein n=1 Tax=Roseovarius sp. E0-M6 TaxID=3127118 RepID=UPI00300F971F
MRSLVLGPLLAGGFAVPAMAETDFTDLTRTERAILHNEIREALLGLPRAALPDAPAPEINLYAEAAATDLDRIAARWAELTAPELPGFGRPGAKTAIALFTRDDCPDCARAEAGLRALAKEFDLRVTLLDITRHMSLAAALELDIAPSYVFKDKMLRGEIPTIVLRNYLK